MLAILTFVLFIAVLVVDIFVWIRYGARKTISDEVVIASKRNPIIACAIGFVFGFLLAHFYFGVCV